MSLAFSSGPRLPHLVRGQGGLAGEITKLRDDVSAAFDTMEQGMAHVIRFDAAPTALLDADGIKTSIASVAAPTTYVNADFNGALAPGSGPALINSPKRVTVTVSAGGTPADWLGGTITVIGTDVDGEALEEDVTSVAGAGTTTTVNYFATVEQVELPAAADVNALLTIGVATDTGPIATFASSSSAQVLDGTDASQWNTARIGNRALDYARRISFVFNSHADWDATTITIRGRDIRGEQITDTILIANGGGTTVTSAKFFAELERITIPAQTGGNGICNIGFLDTELGLDLDPISDVEAAAVIREISRASDAGAWAVPTAGAVDDSSVTLSAPYGKYTPHAGTALIDGIRDHTLVYIPKTA